MNLRQYDDTHHTSCRLADAANHSPVAVEKEPTQAPKVKREREKSCFADAQVALANLDAVLLEARGALEALPAHMLGELEAVQRLAFPRAPAAPPRAHQLPGGCQAAAGPADAQEPQPPTEGACSGSAAADADSEDAARARQVWPRCWPRGSTLCVLYWCACFQDDA